jgi:hypothetical protein
MARDPDSDPSIASSIHLWSCTGSPVQHTLTTTGFDPPLCACCTTKKRLNNVCRKRRTIAKYIPVHITFHEEKQLHQYNQYKQARHFTQISRSSLMLSASLWNGSLLSCEPNQANCRC